MVYKILDSMHALSFSSWLFLLAFCWCCQWVCICQSLDPHYYWPPSCQWTGGWGGGGGCTQASTQFVAGHSTHAGISTGKLSIHWSESTTEHKCWQKTCHTLIVSSSECWLDAWKAEWMVWCTVCMYVCGVYRCMGRHITDQD